MIWEYAPSSRYLHQWINLHRLALAHHYPLHDQAETHEDHDPVMHVDSECYRGADSRTDPPGGSKD